MAGFLYIWFSRMVLTTIFLTRVVLRKMVFRKMVTCRHSQIGRAPVITSGRRSA